MGKVLKIKIKKGELWFGGFTDFAEYMPFGENSKAEIDITFTNGHYNQINPLMISSLGRYVYAENYFKLKVKNGIIEIEFSGEIDFGAKSSAYRAYSYIKDKYFEFDGRMPDKRLFTMPQYCTWMALGENQTAEGVLNYAKDIVNAALPTGELIIDDSWTDYVGQFDFSVKKFPDAKATVDELKKMGFFVSLWITPYVSVDTPVYKELLEKNLLIKSGGKPYIAHWWKESSACIDFTNPAARAWVFDKIERLKILYGIEGVKMDGGDARFYADGLETFSEQGRTANGLSEAYGRFGANYTISELRATCKCGGLPIIQRIADRFHSWNEKDNGFGGIIKRALLMSISGYPYCCPDMVGGGQYEDVEKELIENEELNIRYMQAATFMPCIQFSKPIWNYSKKTALVVRNMLKIRERYAPYIVCLAENAAKFGEPIMRPMVFYSENCSDFDGQFMLGDEILVAPVMEEGAKVKEIYLPQGVWRYEPTGEIFTGEKTVEMPTKLEELPYFTKIRGEI